MPQYTLIDNVTLIDGSGADPVSDAAVLVKDEQIHAVGRKAEIPLPDADVAELDGGGGVLLPGLIDTHVHLMFNEVNLMKQVTSPFSYSFYEAIDNMRRTLDAGITTVRDAGGVDLGTKRAVADGLVAGPRMQISISVLSITGGHGDGWLPSGANLELFAAHPGRPDGRCDGVAEVRRKVREILRAGADVIKVCATGGVLSPTDHPEFTQFSPEELAVMVQEAAYRRGTKVMAHAQGAAGIKNAVRAGIHSIEHGIFLDEEAIELMGEHGTYLVPTLLAPLAVVEIAEEKGTMPEWGVRKARETIDVHRESIGRAYRAGVRIAMGTDAGVMAHGENLRELALMTEIGMSPMEAIVATTQTAAACLGWADRLGTVEKGKLADLVITAVDPLDDIAALAETENITLVMQGGAVVKDTRHV
jgi:imidazolonepropionase-like amidohydrolase